MAERARVRTATWPETKSTGREAVRARSALAALARTEPLAALLGASVGVIAANSGGYWPTSWGWGASIFGWVAAMAVLLRTEVRISRLQWTALGLVAAVAALWLLSSQWSSAP